MDTSSFTLRKGVYLYIFNSKGEVLIFQSPHYKEDEWSLPGGGVEEGEDYKQAALREFEEEFGTNKIVILYECSFTYDYLWDDEVCQRRYQETGEPYKGQSKKPFVARFLGDSDEIKLDPNEIRAYKWIKFSDLSQSLRYDYAFEVSKQVMKEFRQNFNAMPWEIK